MLLELISIIATLVICWGLGLIFTKKGIDEFWERNIMRIGIGLGIIPILGIILNYTVGLSVNWFLALSLLPIAVIIGLNRKFFFNKPSKQVIILLCIFLLFFSVFLFGAFKYNWLEDSDSYGYAQTVAHISYEKTYSKPVDIEIATYAEPTPIGYSILMSLPFQINHNMYFTLKFTNVLIISLGVLFFYFMVKQFYKSENKAIFAAFCLAMIPCFLTHFIFATVLGVLLFFPAFYCLEKTKENKWWFIPASLIIASILITHAVCSIAFGVFYCVYLLFNRKLTVFLSGLFGVLLSLIFWIPGIIKYTWTGLLQHIGVGGLETIINAAGTADRTYTLLDFLIAPSQNTINTSTGIGIALSLSAIIGIIILFKKNTNKECFIPFIWFLIALIMVNLANAPFKIYPFRWWTFMAIPICILAAMGLDWFWSKSQFCKFVALLCLLGIFIFSGIPKFNINTATWSPSPSMMQYGVIKDYAWMKDNLPKNSHVYEFNSMGKLNGFNMYYCAWCKNDVEVGDMFLNLTAEEIWNYLKDMDYQYLVINGFYAEKFDMNKINEKIKELAELGKFRMISQSKEMILLEVVE